MRDPAQRYASADQLLYDLEYYIYHGGYGPTNETLGKFTRELFGQNVPAAPAVRGGTDLMEHTIRIQPQTLSDETRRRPRCPPSG